MSGRISFGPNTLRRINKESRKNSVSIMTVYKTIETALAPEIFSCDRKKTATADPPILVGDIADANSHIATNSNECLSENALLDNMRSRRA